MNSIADLVLKQHFDNRKVLGTLDEIHIEYADIANNTEAQRLIIQETIRCLMTDNWWIEYFADESNKEIHWVQLEWFAPNNAHYVVLYDEDHDETANIDVDDTACLSIQPKNIDGPSMFFYEFDWCDVQPGHTSVIPQDWWKHKRLFELKVGG